MAREDREDRAPAEPRPAGMAPRTTPLPSRSPSSGPAGGVVGLRATRAREQQLLVALQRGLALLAGGRRSLAAILTEISGSEPGPLAAGLRLGAHLRAAAETPGPIPEEGLIQLRRDCEIFEDGDALLGPLVDLILPPLYDARRELTRVEAEIHAAIEGKDPIAARAATQGILPVQRLAETVAQITGAVPALQTALDRADAPPSRLVDRARRTLDHAERALDPRQKDIKWSQSARIAASIDREAPAMLGQVVRGVLDERWVASALSAVAETLLDGTTDRDALGLLDTTDPAGRTIPERLEVALMGAIRPGHFGIPKETSRGERLRRGLGLMKRGKFDGKAAARRAMASAEARRLIPLAVELAATILEERLDAAQEVALRARTAEVQERIEQREALISGDCAWSETQRPHFISNLLLDPIAHTDGQTQARVLGAVGSTAADTAQLAQQLTEAFAAAPAFHLSSHGKDIPQLKLRPTNEEVIVGLARHPTSATLRAAAVEFTDARRALEAIEQARRGEGPRAPLDAALSDLYAATLTGYLALEEPMPTLPPDIVDAWLRGDQSTDQVIARGPSDWVRLRADIDQATKAVQAKLPLGPEFEAHVEPLRKVAVLLDHAHDARRRGVEAGLQTARAIRETIRRPQAKGPERVVRRWATTPAFADLHLEAHRAMLVAHLHDVAAEVDLRTQEIDSGLRSADTDLQLLASARAHPSRVGRAYKKKLQERLRGRLKALRPALDRLAAIDQDLGGINRLLDALPRLREQIADLPFDQLLEAAGRRSLVRSGADLMGLRARVQAEIRARGDRISELRRQVR